MTINDSHDSALLVATDCSDAMLDMDEPVLERESGGRGGNGSKFVSGGDRKGQASRLERRRRGRMLEARRALKEETQAQLWLDWRRRRGDGRALPARARSLLPSRLAIPNGLYMCSRNGLDLCAVHQHVRLCHAQPIIDRSQKGALHVHHLVQREPVARAGGPVKVVHIGVVLVLGADEKGREEQAMPRRALYELVSLDNGIRKETHQERRFVGHALRAPCTLAQAKRSQSASWTSRQ